MRRGKKPSMLRFLNGAVVGLAFIVAAFGLKVMENGFCGVVAKHAPTVNCSIVAPWMFNVAFAIAILGFLFSAYRWYRDFHEGEYYEDLARAGYL
jgi:hypothetical protein